VPAGFAALDDELPPDGSEHKLTSSTWPVSPLRSAVLAAAADIFIPSIACIIADYGARG
jgi:hypothetical protein